MRRWFIAAAVAAGLGASAGVARAQQFKQIEFQEFLVNDRKFHGEYISMHAQFVSDEQVYSSGSFDSAYFKSNGVTDRKYYRFSVQWRAQTKEWLYPEIERKGRGAALWNEVKDLKKGDKLTLYGKVKRLGDTGGSGFSSDPTRTGHLGGGYADVPSILIVMKVKLGWVKPLEEYIADLGGDDELVAETIVMLTREGPGVLPLLAKVAQTDTFSEAQRANACTAIAAFGMKSMTGKLDIVIRDADSERIRTAAIVAMGRLDPEDALKTLGKLFDQREPDEWAPYGMAELVAAGLVDEAAIRSAFSDTWDKRRSAVIDACVDIAQSALERKQWARSETFCTFAIGLDESNGEAYHLRGKARQAQADKRPELAAQARDDFRKAIDLGEEDPDLFLLRAQDLLKAGDKEAAGRYAALVLAKRPNDAAALKIQAAAEGKSVAMIDSRVSRQNGVEVRVPAKWDDLEAYTEPASKKLMLRCRGFVGDEKAREARQLSLIIYVHDHQAPALGLGETAPTAAQIALEILKANNQEAGESGAVDMGKGAEAGFAIGRSTYQGKELVTYWGVAITQGKRILCLYQCEGADFEAARATFAESFTTVRLAAAAK